MGKASPDGLHLLRGGGFRLPGDGGVQRFSTGLSLTVSYVDTAA
ncbi:hypothetical protein [Streptomyces sp. NPDC056190]